MSHALILVDSSAAEAQHAAQLFREHQQVIYRRTDRLFAGLMPLQWLAAIATAFWISPLTWTGMTSHTHPHVYAALLLGGLITTLPVGLAMFCEGEAVTRYVIAVGQMLMSALLIHLMGGRIETHFHIFGSLAFMAFYRDWRVFIPATVVVAADHLLRGIFWPQSVFGILVANPWRWLEHAGWVAFEDTFLLISCAQSVREMRDIARQRARLEETNQRIEAEVTARTAELKTAQKQNLEIARRAGMADIATNVLHNVGNVLNSVNVSASVIGDKLRKSGLGDLRRAAAMLEQHLDDAGEFVTRDPRGKHLPRFLVELSSQMTTEEEGILTEIATLSKGIGHIKEIVTTQQSFAGGLGFVEEVSLAELVEDAVRFNAGSMDKHCIDVRQEFADLPPVLIDKQKFLQIVVNLISNAKNAVLESQSLRREITVRLAHAAGDRARIEIIDNGVGIPAENLTRIFSQGFTTRKTGHGFGLHSAANLATELRGSLIARSSGCGQGATFILEVPFTKAGKQQGATATFPARADASQAAH